MAKLPTRVLILLHGEVALSVALLMRDILLRTNQWLNRECFSVRLVGRPGATEVRVGPVSVRLARAATADHLIVPPFLPGRDPFRKLVPEMQLLERLHRGGTTIHAACLGSLLVAHTGILDGRRATTHWAWIARAAQRFPNVLWDTQRMICEDEKVVTSGGYLAAVDLTLALVERTCTRAASREVGRLLLADSIRQHQSLYATSLVSAVADDPSLRRLEPWIRRHIGSPLSVSEMAAVCRLSVRTFHRRFANAFGVTPTKYLQLKRIEIMRALLRRQDLSVEEAIARVGVTDVPSFRKVFLREMGLSPAEYRRRIRDERVPYADRA